MAFADELLAIMGTAADAWDIRAGVRRCYFYDFVGQPVRLWDGQGILVANGLEWIGTIDALGNNRHRAPSVKDPRDGSSPRYDFAFPYLDATTYAALRGSQDLAIGRDLICYHVLCKAGEALIPTTALWFNYRLAMRGVEFRQEMQGERGERRRVYAMSVIAKPLEYGRMRVPGGTMTDTAQRERARQLGVSVDNGCIFVAQNSRRTYTFPGI